MGRHIDQTIIRMAFRTMIAQLMNCPINYKNAKEAPIKRNIKMVVIAGK